MEATPINLTTDLDQAIEQLDIAVQEACADNPDVNPDDVTHDMISAIAWNCDDATALELCRTKLGYVPHDLELRLGRKDWIE